MASLNSASGERAVRKLFCDIGYPDDLVLRALERHGARAMLEQLIERFVLKHSLYPRKVLDSVAPPFRLEVAEIIDATVKEAGGLAGWPKLLCDHCGNFKPPGKRRDSRFCSDAHRVAAARRRAAGLSESEVGGRGKPFDGSRSSA
jgi:hypothetical protein